MGEPLPHDSLAMKVDSVFPVSTAAKRPPVSPSTEGRPRAGVVRLLRPDLRDLPHQFAGFRHFGREDISAPNRTGRDNLHSRLSATEYHTAILDRQEVLSPNGTTWIQLVAPLTEEKLPAFVGWLAGSNCGLPSGPMPLDQFIFLTNGFPTQGTRRPQ